MLNENLAKIRKEHGMTQEALAVKLNVVRQTVSKWENGTAVPDADMLCRIADALGVTVSELLSGADHEEKTDTESCSYIDKQPASKSRRSSGIRTVLFPVSAVIAAVSVLLLSGNVLFRNTGEPALPDTIEISDVSFSNDDNQIICTFVPSFGKDGAEYSVTLSSFSVPSVTAVSQYENGICTTVFAIEDLSEGTEYRVVASLAYQGEIRNATVAEALWFEDHGAMWQ